MTSKKLFSRLKRTSLRNKATKASTDSTKSTSNYHKKYYNDVVLLSMLFLIGIFYGTLILRVNVYHNDVILGNLMEEYINKYQTQTVLACFYSSMTSTFIFMITSYLLGYSAIFQPITLLLPLIRGMGLGYLMSLIYSIYLIKGVFFCTLIIIPSAIVSFFCILFACRESIKLSNSFFFSFARKNSKPVEISTIRLYTLKLVILLLISIGGAVLEATCFFVFGGIFKF